MRRNSTRRQREWMVERRRSSRVAMRMNTTCGGGSSSVLRKAFWASVDIASAGSMMTTRVRPSYGLRATLRSTSRIWSTAMPVRWSPSAAPSMRTTSTSACRPLSMRVQAVHSRQGAGPGGRGALPGKDAPTVRSQLSAWARWRASVALPTRSGPAKRYAWGGLSPTSPRAMAFTARPLPIRFQGMVSVHLELAQGNRKHNHPRRHEPRDHQRRLGWPGHAQPLCCPEGD